MKTEKLNDSVEDNAEEVDFLELLEELGNDSYESTREARGENGSDCLSDFAVNAAMLLVGTDVKSEQWCSDDARFGHPNRASSDSTCPTDSDSTTPAYNPGTSPEYSPDTSPGANPAYNPIDSAYSSAYSDPKPLHPTKPSLPKSMENVPKARLSIYRGVSKTSKHRWGAKYSSKRVSGSCTTEVEAALHYDKYLQEHQRDKYLQLANFCPCCKMFQNPLKLAFVKSECMCSSQHRESVTMVPSSFAASKTVATLATGAAKTGPSTPKCDSTISSAASIFATASSSVLELAFCSTLQTKYWCNQRQNLQCFPSCSCGTCTDDSSDGTMDAAGGDAGGGGGGDADAGGGKANAQLQVRVTVATSLVEACGGWENVCAVAQFVPCATDDATGSTTEAEMPPAPLLWPSELTAILKSGHLLESQLTSLYNNYDDRDVMQRALFSILPPRGSWKFMHKLTVRQTRWFKLRVSLYCRRGRQPVAVDACLADGNGLPAKEHPWEWCDKVSSTAFVVHTTRLRDKAKQKRKCSLAAEPDKGMAPVQSVQQGVLMDGNNYEMAPPSFVKRQKVSENPTSSYRLLYTKDGIRASTANPTRTGMVGPEGVGPGFGPGTFPKTVVGPGFGPGTFPKTDDFPRIACVDGEWGTYEECKSAADVLALPVAMPHEESPSPAPRLWAFEISPTTKFVGSTVLEATVVVLCIYSNRLRELLYEQPELGYDSQGYDWHSHRILTMFCVLCGVILSTKMMLKQAGLQHKHAALSPCGGKLVLSPCAWWCIVELVRAFVVQMEWWSFAEVLGGHVASTDFGL
jgi:hypothetical protein